MNVVQTPTWKGASADEERISTMAQQMSRWVDQVLGKGFHTSADAWTPAINVYEAEGYYRIVVDLSGVNPDKIELRVENGLLNIGGQRPIPGLPEDQRAVKLLMMEIDHGNFSRSVRVPRDADIEAITATYRCGYLWIRLPKKAKD